MDKAVKQYLSEIGKKGGKKSKRELSPMAAREMVRVREARRAYARFGPTCFWSYDPDYRITLADVPWVAEQLMKNGGLEAWALGVKLCP